MQIQIYGGGNSPSLENRIIKKLEKLEKYNPKIETIKVTLVVSKTEHKASAVIMAGEEFYAEAVSEDMYKTVDLLADKLVKVLNKNREVKQQL